MTQQTTTDLFNGVDKIEYCYPNVGKMHYRNSLVDFNIQVFTISTFEYRSKIYKVWVAYMFWFIGACHIGDGVQQIKVL